MKECCNGKNEKIETKETKEVNKKKKVILITGASSGFGKEVAKELIKEGHRVYSTARRTELMKDLQALGAHVHALDVTNSENVQHVVAEIIKKEGCLDVLFNNAGFGAYGSIESLPLEEIEYQYNVNVFGVARMLKAVLPQMRRQRKGLIINTSSLVGHISTPMLGWYASTKHALKAISDSLRVEVAPLGIDVVMIEPGAVKTDFNNVAFKALAAVNHHEDYHPMVRSFKAFTEKTFVRSPGPESTVKAVMEAIHSRRPKVKYRTTADAKLLPLVKGLVCDRLIDKVILKQLYR